MAGRAALGSDVRGYSVLRNSAMASAMASKHGGTHQGDYGHRWSQWDDPAEPCDAGVRARSGRELTGSRQGTASRIG